MVNIAPEAAKTAQGEVNITQGAVNIAQEATKTAQGRVKTVQGKVNSAQEAVKCKQKPSVWIWNHRPWG
ncbi:hypothetical protein [Marinilabilia salmonicolor]|uniref:hypothetical protein n=1 Tax=Marinilabilia salmonicolor TaxID=989 RepID=UPI0011B1FF43|nr:hypothetical protein [Marinilabilia salmonicolor]